MVSGYLSQQFALHWNLRGDETSSNIFCQAFEFIHLLDRLISHQQKAKQIDIIIKTNVCF